MVLDKKKLAMLSPEERIRKLREFESEKQKEISEAEKLIKENIEELNRRELNQIRDPRVPVSSTAVQQESDLEQTISQAKPEEVADDEELRRHRQYVIRDFNNIIENMAQGTLYANRDSVTESYQRLMRAAGYENTSEEIRRMASFAQRLLEEASREGSSKIRYFP
ncbi:MAG: hypothetical protein QXK37_04305 [Candidatus Woesearchaeota archaeon]